MIEDSWRVKGEDESCASDDARRTKTFLDGRLDSLPGYPIRRERRYVRRRRVPCTSTMMRGRHTSLLSHSSCTHNSHEDDEPFSELLLSRLREDYVDDRANLVVTHTRMKMTTTEPLGPRLAHTFSVDIEGSAALTLAGRAQVSGSVLCNGVGVYHTQSERYRGDAHDTHSPTPLSFLQGGRRL